MQNKISFDYTSIKRLFSKRIKNDDQYPETTHKASAWNGLDAWDGISFMAILGGVRPMVNSFTINLPLDKAQNTRYHNPANREALMQLLREYWSPAYLRLVYLDGEMVDIK